MMKKSTKLLLVIIILSLGIKLSALNQPFYDDETNFVQLTSDGREFTIANLISIHPHPFLGQAAYTLFGKLFGAEVWIFRLWPVILSVINLILIFIITKKEYSEKAALYTSVLYGLCFYPLLAALQIDVEGSLLVTMFLFTTFFYLKYRRSEDKPWLILTGIAFGGALLTKYNAIFIFIIIILHSFTINMKLFNFKSIIKLFHPKNIYRAFIENIIILIFGLAVFSIFPILAYDTFIITISHSSNYLGLNISLMALGMLLLWSTPLLLLLALFKIFKAKKQDTYWIMWVSIILIVNIFLTSGRGPNTFLIGGIADYSRYLMNMIVPLCVLGGVFLSNLKFNKKILTMISIITGIFLGLFYYINLNTTNIISREFGVYAQHIKNLDFSFIFTYTTSSGNLLGVSFYTLVIAYLASTILLITYIYGTLKNKKIKAFSLIIFLGVGIAINIFLVTEFIGPVTSLDVNSATNEVIDSVKLNRGELDLYSNNEGILLLSNDFKIEIDEHNFYTGIYCESCQKLKPNLKDKGGIVAFIDFPPIDEKMWNFVDGCTLIKTTYSKNKKLGYVYIC